MGSSKAVSTKTRIKQWEKQNPGKYFSGAISSDGYNSQEVLLTAIAFKLDEISKKLDAKTN